MACLRPCAKAAVEQHIALEMLASPLVLKKMLPHKIHMQMTHLRQLTCMLLIIALIILCFFLEKIPLQLAWEDFVTVLQTVI